MEFLEAVHQYYHVQGFAKGGDYMYFSFTDTLVKTTMKGTVKCQVEVHGGHLGDIDFYDGKIYGSLLGAPLPGHVWDDWTGFWIYEFDAEDLRLLRKIRLEQCEKYWETRLTDERGFVGIDGTTIAPDPQTGEPKIMTAAGVSVGEKYVNHVIMQFDFNGNYETEYSFPLGNTSFGIQNLDYDWEAGVFWAATYDPAHEWQMKDMFFCFSGDLKKVLKRYPFYSATGLECMGRDGFMISLEFGSNGNRGCIAYRCDEEFIKNHVHTPEYIKSSMQRDMIEEVTGEQVVDGKYHGLVVKG